MNSLPYDVLQFCILDKLDFLSKIRFRQVCKKFYRLEIWDFYNIDIQYLYILTDNILMGYPFIRKLNASYNSKITNVNYMTKLQVLHAGNDCGIDDNGIKDLNLIELNAFNNSKITNVNHMTKLQILYARGDCGIDDNGIKDLNLIKLDSSDNSKITTVNHMTKLQVLNVHGIIIK